MHSPVRDVMWVLMLAAGAYVAWKFGPPYANDWRLASETKDYVAHVARKVQLGKVQNGLLDRIEALGIDMEDVEVKVSADRTAQGLMNRLHVTVRYDPIVYHPVVKKQTELHFEHKRDKVYTVDW